MIDLVDVLTVRINVLSAMLKDAPYAREIEYSHPFVLVQKGTLMTQFLTSVPNAPQPVLPALILRFAYPVHQLVSAYLIVYVLKDTMTTPSNPVSKCDPSCLTCGKFGCTTCASNRVSLGSGNCVCPENTQPSSDRSDMLCIPQSTSCEVGYFELELAPTLDYFTATAQNTLTLITSPTIDNCKRVFKTRSLASFGEGVQCTLKDKEIKVVLGK